MYCIKQKFWTGCQAVFKEISLLFFFFQKMDLVLVPEKFHGHFYESDCYLLLSVSEKNLSETYITMFCCEKSGFCLSSVEFALRLVAELCLVFVSPSGSLTTRSSAAQPSRPSRPSLVFRLGSGSYRAFLSLAPFPSLLVVSLVRVSWPLSVLCCRVMFLSFSVWHIICCTFSVLPC